MVIYNKAQNYFAGAEKSLRDMRIRILIKMTYLL